MSEITQTISKPVEIPTSETYGAGIYAVRIAGAKVEDDRNGCLMVSVEFRITDDDFANSPIYDRIRIGTETDPMASDPNTWKAPRGGGRRFARLLTAAGVQGSDSLNTDCDNLRERHLSIKVTEREYEGNMYNNVPAYYPMGERESGRDGDRAAHGAPPANPRPVANGADPSQQARPATPPPTGQRYE